jgi:hypothetical protein
VVFAKGDFVQVEDKYYPFTVTSPVLRGSDSSITVPVHRPNFISSSVVGANILVGASCQFNMICVNMPTYTVSPGGNGGIITFDDDFQLYESTGAEGLA